MSRLAASLATLALLCLSTASALTCGGAGYDVSSIANIGDLSWTDATARWQYFVNPCGFVTNTNCTDIVGTTSTLCQYGPTSKTGHSLASYTPEASTWDAGTDGQSVVQRIQDGEQCATINAPRVVEFIYRCNASATTPALWNVSEATGHPCHYTAIIHTAAVCQHGTAPGPEGAVGTEYLSEKCGGGRYDLSPFATGQDLYLDSNVTLTTGWSWFLRPCGTVSHPNCTAAGPAMLCQANKANANSPHPASVYNDSTAGSTKWLITATGISMAIQDGQLCSATYPFPRETTVDFRCVQSATTAQLVSVTEVEKCYYTAVVQTNLVCPDKLLVGLSSTGGAVASSGGSVTPVQSSSGGTVTPPGNGGVSVAASGAVVAVLLALVSLLL